MGITDGAFEALSKALECLLISSANPNACIKIGLLTLLFLPMRMTTDMFIESNSRDTEDEDILGTQVHGIFETGRHTRSGINYFSRGELFA